MLISQPDKFNQSRKIDHVQDSIVAKIGLKIYGQGVNSEAYWCIGNETWRSGVDNRAAAVCGDGNSHSFTGHWRCRSTTDVQRLPNVFLA